MIENLKLFFSKPQSRTVGLVFALNSLMFGSWITHLPEIKERLQITDGELGLALLGVPLGSIIAMPFMGWIIHRFGSGKTTMIYGIAFCIISSFPVLAPDYALFFASLILVGMSTGSMDVAMNAAAASVEKKMGKNIMSSCHGMWSLGGMAGAGITSILVGFHIDAGLHIVLLAALLFIILLILRPVLISVKDERATEVIVFTLPRGPLIGLAVIAFCVMMGEGAVYDWSAIYLDDTLQANAFYSGLGLSGFSMTMTLGRFYGDKVIHLWGAGKTVIAGVLISIVGILIVVAVNYPLMAIAGFTLAGLGFSCLVPTIYISASRMKFGSPGGNL
ncbi:MAG TPA: MFS transporter, partial [Cyclobacteriaceae bacterium]|nr:MFS transporter [Cyclobacteriaceae bacterium]